MYFTHCQGQLFVSNKKPEYIRGFDYFEFDPSGKDLSPDNILDFNQKTKTLFTQKGNFKLTKSQIHLLETDTIETIPNLEVTITTVRDDEIIIQPPRKIGKQKVVRHLTAGKHKFSFSNVGSYKIYSKNYISNILCITVRKPKTETTQNFLSIS